MTEATVSQLRGDILRYLPSTILPALIALLHAFVFTRVFSPAEYGRYSLMLLGVTVASTVACQWLQQAIIRFLPGRLDPPSSVPLKLAFAISLALTEAVFVASGTMLCLVLSPHFDQTWQAFYAPAVLLTAVTIAFGTLIVVLQAQMRPVAFSIYRLSNVAIGFALSLLFVFSFERHISSLLWGGILASALLVPALWRATGMPGYIPRGPEIRDAFGMIPSLLAYGFPLTVYVIMLGSTIFLDRYWIQLFRNSAEVGIYSAAYVLATGAVNLAATPILFAVHPLAVKTWESGDRVETIRVLDRLVRWEVAVTMIGVTLTALCAEDLSGILLGPDFRIGHKVMPLIVAAAAMGQLGSLLHKPFELEKRPAVICRVMLVVLSVDVAMSFMLVPRLGYLGTAIATLIGNILYCVTIDWKAGSRLLCRAMTTGGIQVKVVLLSLATSLGVRAIAPTYGSGEWNTSRFTFTICIGALYVAVCCLVVKRANK